MAYPEFKSILEIGFTNNRTGYWELGVSTLGETTVLGGGGIAASVDFVPVADVLTGTITITRGRPTELEQCEAGTMSFTLDNASGNFTPTNTLGKYYGSLKPLRQVRLSILADGVTYPMFHGFVEDWVPSRTGNVPLCDVPCSDLFLWMADWKLTRTFDTMGTGQRISKVLDAVEWDTNYRAIDAGLDTVAGTSISDKSALDEIKDLCNCERGVFFIAGDGYATYHDRDHRNASSAPIVLTMSDHAGDYVSIKPDTFSANNIYNQVTENGIILYTDADPASTSIAEYGIRTLELPQPYVPIAQKVLLAKYLVATYRQTNPRYTISLEIKNHHDRARYLPLEISDMIHVVSRADGIDANFFIEHITHTIPMSGGAVHTMELSISPTDPATYWQLGYSTLGETTILGY